LLLVSDRYLYNGKTINISFNVAKIVQALASKGLEKVVVVGQLEKDQQPTCLPSFDHVKTFDWPSFLRLDNSTVDEIEFRRSLAMVPVYILYSSNMSTRFPLDLFIAYDML
jgi:hypothetical protein